MKDRIYLSSPHMGGEEMKYIQEAFDTNWVAPLGKNVEMFEKEMCEYIGRPYAVALSAGTAAIHLGLKYLGVERGDVVCFDGHVGIYMGNGKMIDASSSRGKVRTTSNIQSSSYWTSHFICGFRIF